MPDWRLQLGQLACLNCFTRFVAQQTTMALCGQKVCERKVGLMHPAPGLASHQTVLSQDEAIGWSQQHLYLRFPDHFPHPVQSPVPKLPLQHRRREGINWCQPLFAPPMEGVTWEWLQRGRA